ncbi:MAG: hypothetical protein AAB805_02245 [Patescibacteria group bacterium]
MFIVNYERAIEVILAIAEALMSNEFPFENALRPQDSVRIDGNRLEQSQFWFYACHYMRGAINSTTAIRRLAEMRNERPNLFVPNTAQNENKEDLEKYLRGKINYHSGQIAQFWIDNSQLLAEHYANDPRAIYAGMEDYRAIHEIVANKRVGKKERANGFAGFHGFQRKMSGMLTYFLLDQRLIPDAKFSMAIDFHIIRVLTANGVIVSDTVPFRYCDDVQVAALDALAYFHERHPEYPMSKVCDALWLLSSALCNKSPWNQGFDITGEKMESRRRHMRKNGVDPAVRKKDVFLKLPFPEEAEFNHSGWMKTGNALRREATTCGRCPACDTCRHGVPSWDYYQEGLFVLREK